MQRILRSGLAAFPLFLLAAFFFLPGSAAAQPNCAGFCNPLAPCTVTCNTGTTYKNCLQYNGVCNRDPDGDGVDIVVDNCPNHANSNQADCDSDGKGNVCDNLNGAFAPVGNRIACASTKDEYPFYTEFIVTYQQKHVDTSSCGAPDRWNHARNIESCYGACDGLEETPAAEPASTYPAGRAMTPISAATTSGFTPAIPTRFRNPVAGEREAPRPGINARAKQKRPLKGTRRVHPALFT